ncbi:DUF4270 domain-containing protein [Phocaeicola sp.]
MKIKYLCALLLAALVYSCDDTTPGVGDSTIPGGDHIPAGAAMYKVVTKSMLADSVYARTSTAYLGRYTDPQFGEFTADFITQFYCTDDFEFPEEMTKVTGLDMIFQYTFFGDSTNAMRMQIDTLDKIIPEKDLNTFYTSVDPADYYNERAKPIAMKAFSPGGAAVDTVFSGTTTHQQTVKLPIKLGEYMFEKYKENKDYYKDAQSFINNVLKGFYVHCTHGDGSILYINNLLLTLRYEGMIESSSGEKDSVVYRYDRFAATKEVIQANRFQNSEKLKELVDQNNCTYIKSPAGIYTTAVLPIEEIYEEHQRDTLNAASIAFTRYNDSNDSKYKMGTPQYLLMIRKKDLYSFFENNKTYDGETSFVTSFSSSSNTYTFSNIARLISYCINEKKNGEKTDPNWLAKNPEWNQVVLIPVKVDMDSNKNIIGVQNNLDMESARLKGGTKVGNELNLQILYTTF